MKNFFLIILASAIFAEATSAIEYYTHEQIDSCLEEAETLMDLENIIPDILMEISVKMATVSAPTNKDETKAFIRAILNDDEIYKLDIVCEEFSKKYEFARDNTSCGLDLQFYVDDHSPNKAEYLQERSVFKLTQNFHLLCKLAR